MAVAKSRRTPPEIPDISAGSWNNMRGPVHRALKFLTQYAFDSLPGLHAFTHLKGGSDALQTPGTPATLDPNVGAVVGVGPSYSYEDHKHALDLKLTTKGDLLAHTGAAYARKAQEAVADGSALLKDSAQATGMRWGAIGETDQLILAASSLLPHPPRIPEVQAGTNVTITYNALGPIVASTGGGSAVDSDQNILATQVFGG